MKVNDSLIVIVLAQAVLYGTPLLYAALGELLAERSGVLNLGVEGMMLFGAVVGYWVTQRVEGSPATRAFPGRYSPRRRSGGAMAAIHAFLVVTLRANQIVSGLALTIFAGGPRSLGVLRERSSASADTAPTHSSRRSTCSGSPISRCVGPILFDQSALVYASWGLTLLVGSLSRSNALGPQRARSRRSSGRRLTPWGSTSRSIATST